MIARIKPDVLTFHSGTNDLTNGINTMTKVKKLDQINQLYQINIKNLKIFFKTKLQLEN